MKCPNCNGTGEEYEICCKDRQTAILHHCACKGRPISKQDCKKCNGTGEIFNLPPVKLKIKEKPYLIEKQIVTIKSYNPKYGDKRKCKCGHLYNRHFDSYEDMKNIGCKYCRCWNFKEKEEFFSKWSKLIKNIKLKGDK